MAETPPENADKAESAEQPARMSFGDHLDELRVRMVRSLLAIVIAVGVVLPFKSKVTEIYMGPYRQMWAAAFEGHIVNKTAEIEAAGGIENVHKDLRDSYLWLDERKEEILSGAYPPGLVGFIASDGGFPVPYTLMAIGGLEDFWTFMAATILFALLMASPVVIMQGWGFIAAGLHEHERKVVTKHVPAAVGLAATGVLFGYFAVVPFGLYFLVNMMEAGQVAYMPSVSQYFSFFLTLTIALGAVFQLPLVMLAVQKVGLLSHSAMRKNWRYVVLGMFVVSAMLTPPDPFTQSMMAGPLMILYCLGLFLTYRAEKGKSDYQPAPGDAI